MKILVFRLTDADSAWYVWPCASPQVYSFGSDGEAERFAKEIAEAQGGMPVRMERSIEQAAALV